MNERADLAMAQQPDGPRNVPRGRGWVSWLLAAAACVYGVEAVLIIAMRVPDWVIVGSLAAVFGLVGLACLVGIGRALQARVLTPSTLWQGYPSYGAQGTRGPVKEVAHAKARGPSSDAAIGRSQVPVSGEKLGNLAAGGGGRSVRS
ncbi:MAG: hypothetical protein HY680_10375 [Chloroflexi bacterium]|nr:hypothetical protein [Chloroflexota bacterium]